MKKTLPDGRSAARTVLQNVSNRARGTCDNQLAKKTTSYA
jgi:hypothetical protein